MKRTIEEIFRVGNRYQHQPNTRYTRKTTHYNQLQKLNPLHCVSLRLPTEDQLLYIFFF